MLTLTLGLTWPAGRTVQVQVRALPLLRDGWTAAKWAGDVVPLDSDDVASLAALRAFLTRATRRAPEGDTVRVVGFEPDVFAALDLLGIDGPPPATIVVEMT